MKELKTLYHDFWETQMRRWPHMATFVGHPGYDDALEDNSAAGRRDERESFSRLLARARSASKARLPENDLLSCEVLRWQSEKILERQALNLYQWGGFFNLGVDHMDGIQSSISTTVQVAQPMKTDEDARALIRRLAAMPLHFQNHVDNLREGLAAGRVATRKPVEKTIRQLEELLKTKPADTAFALAIPRLPEKLRGRYRDEILKAIERFAFPAFLTYLDFLKKEYLHRTRPETRPGICFVPGGEKAYRHLISFHGTDGLSPKEIHEIGLEELRGLREEEKGVASRMGHHNGGKSFQEKLRNNPKNFFTTREEIVANAKHLVKETYKLLPKYFGVLPKTPLIVEPIERYKEKNDVGARYFPPPRDLSRPGVYYINTYEPKSRARFSMSSLAAHEGVPGHHLQIAIAVENKKLPLFRRYADPTAFIEGWALYSERLADEMGLYRDDLARVGMIKDQAFRASRLVVDTGLHAMGWTRQKAIDFMKDNTPMSEGEIIAEIDRYTIWPGQALAYKLGQRAIMQLRREIEKGLRSRFNIAKFHDAVLRHGALPLSVMRDAVRRELL